MEKTEYIQIIDSLYPIDSGSERTDEIGERLLIETIREYGWRNLPIDVLALYAAKSIDKQNPYMKGKQ